MSAPLEVFPSIMQSIASWRSQRLFFAAAVAQFRRVLVRAG